MAPALALPGLLGWLTLMLDGLATQLTPSWACKYLPHYYLLKESDSASDFPIPCPYLFIQCLYYDPWVCTLSLANIQTDNSSLASSLSNIFSINLIISSETSQVRKPYFLSWWIGLGLILQYHLLWPAPESWPLLLEHRFTDTRGPI